MFRRNTDTFPEMHEMFREMDDIFDYLFTRMTDDSMDLRSGIIAPVSDIPDDTKPVTPEPVPSQETGMIELVPEVLRDAEGVTIAIGIPGVTEENLNIAVRRSTLVIDAVSGDRIYHAETRLPPGSDPSTTAHSLRNGVLEVRVQAASSVAG